jgi:predicted DNA-binding protein
VSVRVPPEVFARIEAESESRTLPASVIIREALARAFVQKAAWGSKPF